LTIETVVNVHSGSMKSAPSKGPMMESGSNSLFPGLVASDRRSSSPFQSPIKSWDKCEYESGCKLTRSSMFSPNADPSTLANKSEPRAVPTSLLRDLSSLLATASNGELWCLAADSSSCPVDGSSSAWASGSFFKSPTQVLKLISKSCMCFQY
jgi:hypothetical protein